MAWPRWNAMPRTSSGVMVCASTRGDGWLPIMPASRDTRPPSSSTLTASGSGLAEAAMSASGAPIIDRSVQLPIMMPPTCWLSTTARASSAPVTPTINSCASLSRTDIEASTSPQAGGAGAAGSGLSSEVFDGLGVRCGGLFGGGRAGQQQAGHRRENTEYTGQGHAVMLSWRNRAVTRCWADRVLVGSHGPVSGARCGKHRCRPSAGRGRHLRDHADGAAGHQAAGAGRRSGVGRAEPCRVRRPQLA